MPQAIPAVVSWAAAAWSSAVAATAVAVSTVTAGAIAGTAATAVASAGLKFVASTAISLALSALMRPNTPSSGTALDFKPDPKAPVRGLMGYHATGGNKVFQATWGYNGVAMSLGVALSLGPIDAITSFQADGSGVSFTGPQNEAVGFYKDDMWQKTTLGLPTDAAILPPVGLKYSDPPLSGWGAANAAKGVAFAFWTMLLAKNPEDRHIFVNGVPDPRWVGRWMKVYDWREDDTYPGGSGSQRENDWRTWRWSENPYVHARAWLRGHYKLNDDGSLDYSKRIAGVGVTASAIDHAAFTEAANIADTNQWKISGEWSTSDNKWQVLAGMLQAGSGTPINRGAQISVMVNAPRVSTYTYTAEDMVGQGVVKPLTRRRDRKNTVIPRYRSEVHNWEYVAATDVTASVYRTEDRGEPRSTEIQYTYVRDAKQAAQLAAYDLVNMREGITITLPSKVHLMHIHAGDCITVNVPDMALANQKVIVLRTNTDYKGAVVSLECRSETDGKHAFALGQAAAPPPSPSLSSVNPIFIPPPTVDDIVVTPQPPSGGTSQPIIIVDAPVDRGDISAVIVEYGLSDVGPWLSAGPADPATGKYQISGLNPGASYWISTRYVANNGLISERYVTGPHPAPGLVAGDVDPNAPTITALDAAISDLENAQASETLIREQQVNQINARSALRQNLIDNPSGASDFRSWIKEGGPVTNVYDDPTLGRMFRVTNYMVSRAYPASPGDTHSLGFMATPDGDGGHVRIQYATPAGLVEGVFVAAGSGDASTRRRSSAPSVAPAGTTAFRLVVAAPPAGVLNVWGIKVNYGNVASDFTDDYTTKEIQASVTQNSLAVVDLETQQALAKYEVVAAASGGKPARLKLVSSSLGSAVALDAPYIFFGDNTVFDDATDTLSTTVGSVRYVQAWGAPFGPDNLVRWNGPSSVAAGTETKANAGVNGSWLDSSGAQFTGGATLSGPFDSGTQNPGGVAINLTTWTTVSTIPEKFVASIGGWIWQSRMEYVLDTVPGNLGGIDIRLVTTDQSNGDLRVVTQTVFNATADSVFRTGGTPYMKATAHASTAGSRKVLLQARIASGFGLTNGSIRNAQFDGVYYA